MNTPSPLIVFDLDGTLIDTAPDLIATLNDILVSNGLDEVDIDQMRPKVGFGSRFMLTHAYEKAEKHMNPEKLDTLVADFIERYADNMPGTSAPYDGLLEILPVLKEEGFQFAVCTNKTEMLAKKLLSSLELAHWFEAVTGQDTFSVRKPHPDHLLKTITKAGGNPKHAVMVGDTPTDFSTAKAAKVPVIAVDFGYCAEPVQQYEPDEIISHFTEMTSERVLSLINR